MVCDCKSVEMADEVNNERVVVEVLGGLPYLEMDLEGFRMFKEHNNNTNGWA